MSPGTPARDQEGVQESWFHSIRLEVDQRLEQLLAGALPEEDNLLLRSMRYSLLSGGKRLRPLLAILTAEALGTSRQLVLGPACALEMLHTASLILDDLPCMDNSAQRRGQPTNHIAFGESVATISSVALISEAFQVVAADTEIEANTDIIRVLTKAIGPQGLCGGQHRDLLLDHGQAPQGEKGLESIHAQKTGALFSAAVEIAILLSDVTEADALALQAFSQELGLAFQLFDDLLDIKGNPQNMGKDVHRDSRKNYRLKASEIEAAALARCSAARTALLKLGSDRAKPLVVYLDSVLDISSRQLADAPEASKTP